MIPKYLALPNILIALLLISTIETLSNSELFRNNISDFFSESTNLFSVNYDTMQPVISCPLEFLGFFDCSL